MSHSTALGPLAILGLLFLAAAVVSRLRLGVVTKRLLLLGLALRVLGGLSYLLLFDSFYGGGDYLIYFEQGAELARSAAADGRDSIWDPSTWTEGRWWGTPFVMRMTGVLLFAIGPTLPGGFMAFSVISYIGIISLGLAFHRAFPEHLVERYLAWLALFPSLWFWPAALGKDALVLCGIGVAVLGFVGRDGRTSWAVLAAGLALVFAVRPQVAVVVVVGFACAQWIAGLARPSPLRVAEGLSIALAGVLVMVFASGELGFDFFSPEDVEGYFETRAQASTRGGSAIGRPDAGVTPWLAPINTLFRPFPWEARGFTSLVAALEVVVVWVVAWRRRRSIRVFVRTHTSNRLLWFAAAFVLLYATALGMSLGNIGIIARQRVHLLPFIFLFFAGPDARLRSVRRWGSGAASTHARMRLV